MKLRANIVADAAILTTTIVWGTTFVVARDVLDSWPPVSYLSVRMALAALIFFALFPRLALRAKRDEVKAGAALGLLVGGGMLGLTVSLLYTSAAKSAFIASLTTPLVPFVGYALFRTRPGRENLIGIALATAGGALILAPSGAEGFNTGDLIALCCTALFATHLNLLGRYARRHDPRSLTVLQIAAAACVMCGAWLGLWLWGAAAGADSMPPGLARELTAHELTARVAWQIGYLAVFATVLTFLLWTWGQARMTAAHAAVIFSLEPVFATLFAVAARGWGEWPGGRANLGALLIVAGVVVSEIGWGRREREKEEEGAEAKGKGEERKEEKDEKGKDGGVREPA